MNKIIIAIIVLLAGGGALLLGKTPTVETPVNEPVKMEHEGHVDGMDMSVSETTNTPEAPTVQNQAVVSAVKEFTVVGSNFMFDPATITVNRGDKVKITFKNSGGMHDWRIDEFGVATKKIKTGEEEVLEFTADKVGTFEYYCSVGEHRMKGMKGTLTVK